MDPLVACGGTVLFILVVAAVVAFVYVYDRAQRRHELINMYLEFCEINHCFQFLTVPLLLSRLEGSSLREVKGYWEVIRHLETGHKKRARGVFERMFADWCKEINYGN